MVEDYRNLIKDDWRFREGQAVMTRRQAAATALIFHFFPCVSTWIWLSLVL